MLSALAPRPTGRPLDVPGAAVDVFGSAPGEGRGVAGARHVRRTGAPLVLVHGFAPEGKDDRRLRDAAMLLARAGFEVAVPTIPGLTRGRLRPDDVEPVVATIARRPGSTTVVAVSIGSGPALLAAAHPRVRAQVATVVTLGGYGSAEALVRFFLTGDYSFGGVRGHVAHDPAVVRMFLGANADLLGAQQRADLETLDPRRVADTLPALPASTRRVLEALSPERVVRDTSARLVLVHGRDDPAVPYTETLRLAAAAHPERTRIAVVGVISHVERGAVQTFLQATCDLVALFEVAYVLVAEARSTPG